MMNFPLYLPPFMASQVVKLHCPTEHDYPVEIGRTEIISNTLNPNFVTIIPIVSCVYTCFSFILFSIGTKFGLKFGNDVKKAAVDYYSGVR